jgi:hypothetical protein
MGGWVRLAVGISIKYRPKHPTKLTDFLLKELGVASLSQRSSFFIAKKLAKLNGKKTFMDLRSAGDIHWIDLKGGQIIPYQWDRRSYERKKNMMAALKNRESQKMLHVVLRPAWGWIPILDMKAHIAAFRKFLTLYNKSGLGPKILLSKFEADCHLFCRSDAYLHVHALIDTNDEWAFKKAWAAFASKHGLPRMVAEAFIVRERRINRVVSYLAKYPIMVCVHDKKYPMYHPRAMHEVKDVDLLDLQEAMHRTQFVWLPRKPRAKPQPKATVSDVVVVVEAEEQVACNLNIRPLFNDPFAEWLTQWINDYRHLQAFRGGVLPSSAEKRAFERQILKAYNDSRRKFGKWMPIGYFSEIGRVLINWPVP